MHRCLDDRVRADQGRKLVIITGRRRVGKTTLARQLSGGLAPAQHLSWDTAADRVVLQRQSWLPAPPAAGDGRDPQDAGLESLAKVADRRGGQPFATAGAAGDRQRADGDLAPGR